MTRYAPDPLGDTPFPWQEDAACAQTDPDMFFPDAGEFTVSREARKICGTCPVVMQCAELGMGFDHGIFGGLTSGQRKKIRRAA